ncbi:hypothetical protein HGRIS_011881 [Hohenbuehelia grisea]|uniref:F-box domain-containing protein n=1 Tax=Hohenbuehelia grisea TaxID=104357 RepID=A0ABR3JXB3_9AGAR
MHSDQQPSRSLPQTQPAAQMSTSVRKLAPELLMQIFNVVCGIDYSFLQIDHDPSRPLPPLTADHINDLLALSQVCSQWRKVAIIGMPKLWSIFPISWSHQYRERQSWLPWLQLCLERSASSPLHIDIRAAHGTGYVPPPVAEVVSLFLPHHSRWRSFQCVGCCPYCTDRYCDPELFRSIQCFNNLEIAYVDLDDNYPHFELHFHRAILASPRIRRYYWRHADRHPSLPPAGVEYLGVRTLPLVHAAQAFACATNLRSTHLSVADISPPSSDSSANTITIAKLHTLNVSFYCSPRPLLCLLTLPSLRNLHFNFRGSFDPSDVHAFRRLLARSQCMVESFAVFSDDADGATRAEMMKLICDSPALESVQDLMIPISHLELLSLPPCMPHLRRLRVWQGYSPSCPLLHAVAAFGASRPDPSGAGDTLYLPEWNQRQTTEDYLHDLQRILSPHGLQLTFPRQTVIHLIFPG